MYEYSKTLQPVVFVEPNSHLTVLVIKDFGKSFKFHYIFFIKTHQNMNKYVSCSYADRVQILVRENLTQPPCSFKQCSKGLS